MTGGITVIGLVQGGYLLEDIRTTVPHRMPIQIPAHLAERSQDLVEALQQRRVMRLGSAAVVKEAAPQLNASLRGRGIAPIAPVAKAELPPPTAWGEREALVVELEATREQCRHLRALNEALQSSLTGLTAQLVQIQDTLDVLVRSRGSTSVSGPQPGARTFVETAVPHFIPDTSLEPAEVRINLPESTSTSNLDDARAALRSLRGKSA